MSAPNVPAADSGLGYKAEDFLASPAVVGSRMGGMNPFSLDNTAVLNMPPCVCPDCQGRNKMVPLWAYPSSLGSLIEQGWQLVPEFCFKDTYNNGRPVRPTSPYFVVRDGRGVREPGMCEVLLFYTTCSNYARLQRLEGEAVMMQQDGRMVRGNYVGDAEGDADARKMGMVPEDEHTPVTVDRFTKDADGVSRTRRPLTLSVPGKANETGPPNF